MPISAQEDNLNGSETDIDDQEILDQEDAPLNPTESNMHLGQVPSGRHITFRDALKTLAAFISLGISITWLISRSNEDKSTYLYLAPLVSTIAWVRAFSSSYHSKQEDISVTEVMQENHWTKEQ